MITMSHDAVLFQGPLPSTAEAGRACLYKEKPTTRSVIRQKVNSQRDGAVAGWAFPGPKPSLPGCQSAPFILPCLQNTSLEALGICSCPKGLRCMAVCLRSLSTAKSSRSSCAPAAQLEASGLRLC